MSAVTEVPIALDPELEVILTDTGEKFRRRSLASYSSQTCSAYRKAFYSDAYLNFKFGEPFMMRTGYKLYEKTTSEYSYASGVGDQIVIMFDSGLALTSMAAAYLALYLL